MYAFWIIVALVAWLLMRNVRTAISRYALEHGLAWLVTYFILLAGLGFLVLNLTFRLLDLVATTSEPDVVSPTPYVLMRLRDRRALRPSATQAVRLTASNVDAGY